MIPLSRATIILTVAIFGIAQAQTCPSNDNGQCDFEPTNPYSCGADYTCAYSNRCLAEAAGFNIEADCCQAPMQSLCGMISSPLVCGNKQCPYANECLASLAGYDPSQCTAPPPTCPVSDVDCSGEPSNPYTCGPNNCPYNTVCDAEGARFDLGDDCCQDTRSNTVCTSDIASVSCGPPGGKQCVYSNQCLADSAGYNLNQCCNAVPDGIVCTTDFKPVECGSIPCVYSNQCQADAAGATDCCPQVPEGIACTTEYKPVKCGSEQCEYANQCLADAAGYSSDQCCNAVPDDAVCDTIYEPVTCGPNSCEYSNQCEADAAGATECCRQPVNEGCTLNYAPIMCGKDSCRYDNECIAEKSGFDPNSCVPDPNTPAQTGISTLADRTVNPSGCNSLGVTFGLMVSSAVIVLEMMM